MPHAFDSEQTITLEAHRQRWRKAQNTLRCPGCASYSNKLRAYSPVVAHWQCSRCMREWVTEKAKELTMSDQYGWLYFNEAVGLEWSLEHPVLSGKCVDAQSVRPATAKAAVSEMLSAWKAIMELQEPHGA